MGIFGMIKNYAIAFAVGLIGLLYVKTKYQEGKIDNLEADNARFEALDDINKITDKAEVESEKVEDKEIREHDDSNWRDEI